MKKFTMFLMLSLLLKVALATVNFNVGILYTNDNDIRSAVEPGSSSIAYSLERSGTLNYSAGTQNMPVTGVAGDPSSVTFYLSGGFMSYSGAAIITFDGTDYDYDNGLGFNTIPCTIGTHTYVITPSNVSKAILRGTVDVPTVDDVPLGLTIVNGYKVEIFTIDNASNPIEGASVTMDGQTLTTDATGDAIFMRAATGDYTYSVSKAGYKSVDANPLTVNTADVIETVTLQQPSVTFYLSGGFMSYSGAATITFDGTDYDYDNGLGFNTIPCTIGTHTYIITPSNVSKAILRGTVDVPTVDDVPLGLTIDNGFKVEIFTTDNASNPIAGSSVTMDGQTIATDASGDAIFMRKASGAYTYSIAKSGYKSAIGTATLVTADLVITTVLEIDPAYKVTVTAYDNSSWPQAPLSAASVTFNGSTVVTDVNGVAMLPDAVNGSYDYTVSKAGFVTVKGTAQVADADLNIDVYLKPAFSVQFTVTDGANPLANASIRLVSSWPVFDETFMTNAQGVVLTDKLFPSWTSFNYTVSADGFADAMGTVNMQNENLIVDPITLKRAYAITFTVNDGTNLLMDAAVKINNTVMVTNASGNAVFPVMINGDYTYLVSKLGYGDVTGTVTVMDGNAVKTVSLAMGYNLTFNIINGPSGTVGLANDTITINGISKITDATGTVIFGVAPNAVISFVNKKAGFIDVPVEIASVGSDMLQAINMVPVYNVIIRAMDGNSYNPIAGATVLFNGITTITDVDGNAYFPNTAPKAEVYKYTVTGPGTYNSVTDSIALPFTSTEEFLATNNVVSRTPTEPLTSPYVYIALGGFLPYYGAATITVDGIDYEYNTGFGANLVNCTLGTHTYVVTPADLTKAIARGTFELTIAEPSAYVGVEILDARKIEIYTIDAASDPIVGASVTFGGTTVLTDATGLALFDRYPAGSYTYSVTMDNYVSVAETALDVNTSDVMEVITLVAINTGIHEASAKTVKLYPNPTSGNLNINLPENNGKEATIRVTNIIGSVILENKVVNGSSQLKVDVSGFENGIYFVTVKGSGYENTIKVVKK